MKTSRSLSLVSTVLAIGFLQSCGSGSNVATPAASACGANPTVVNIPVNAAGKGAAGYGAPLTITKGTTVKWVNQDTMFHTVTAAGTFDSGALAAGASYCQTFNTAGTYNYLCTIHGGASMSGVVTVN